MKPRVIRRALPPRPMQPRCWRCKGRRVVPDPILAGGWLCCPSCSHRDPPAGSARAAEAPAADAVARRRVA